MADKPLRMLQRKNHNPVRGISGDLYFTPQGMRMNGQKLMKTRRMTIVNNPDKDAPRPANC
jgi:hypothetical protein